MKEEKVEQTEEIVKEQDKQQESEELNDSAEAQDEQGEEDQESDEALDPEEVLKAEVQEAKDKYLRLYSEFENFRRRTSKEKLDLISTASRELMEALLPVMDDFERSMQLEKDESDNKGVKLIYNKLNNILTNKGLKKMEIKPGDEFDDEYHEAITQIPAPEPKLAGKIVDVVEPGYYLGEKVIRFAKVVTGAKE